jgi:hypothetical protein
MGILPPGSDRLRTPDQLLTGSDKLDIKVCPIAAPRLDAGKFMVQFFHDLEARGELPHRAGMPYRGLLPVLSNIFILEPLDATMSDWRFRLVGQGIATRLGADPTGLCISDIYEPAQVANNAASYAGVTASLAPHITTGTFYGIKREYLNFEIVHLPMVGKDNETILILGGLFFDD